MYGSISPGPSAQFSPNGTLVVHLGSGNYLDRYKIYVRHIAEWRQQFNKLESVDLRFNGQVIVNADGRASTNGPKSSAGEEKANAVMVSSTASTACWVPTTARARW